MADWLELCKIALDGFGQRLRQVTDWHAPTPDTEWDVTDLVKHVVGEQQWVAPLTAGKSVKEASTDIESLDDENLPAAWDRYSEEALRSWAQAPADGMVSLSYGEVPIEHYLREMVCDATVHTWDLARSIGADETLDPTLVAAVWDEMSPKAANLEASGMFAPPVPVDEDASLQDRLLALSGRSPS